MTYRVLLTDGIDRKGADLLRSEAQLAVDDLPTQSPADLLERIGKYDAIVVRGATRVTEEALRRGSRLKVVGRAGVGVDNIALDAATELGIAVINAPAGNAVAVAELLFGSLLALLRHIPAAAESMRAGKWERSRLLGRELKGRTAGLVGLGRIGGEVAGRAHAFGMQVAGFDPYVTDERFRALRVQSKSSLEDLLAVSDVLSIHTPLSAEAKRLIGAAELARLPQAAIVVNFARGGIVDEDALAEALRGGRLGGAVLDVFETEPLPADHPLRSAPNAMLTPHLGASTAEAQRNVAVDVCRAVRDALVHGELSRSINLAVVADGRWREVQPGVVAAQRIAAVGRAMLADEGIRGIRRLTLRCGTGLVDASPLLLSAAAVGVLEGVLETGRINLINARALAEARGLELALSESLQLEQAHAVEVGLTGAPSALGGARELVLAAVVPTDGPARITRIGRFHVDVTPRQALIVLTNDDVPGVIGRVGTLLGDAGVNIAEYHQARLAQGGEALAAISVDGEVSQDISKRLLAVAEVRTATVVNFG